MLTGEHMRAAQQVRDAWLHLALCFRPHLWHGTVHHGVWHVSRVGDSRWCYDPGVQTTSIWKSFPESAILLFHSRSYMAVVRKGRWHAGQKERRVGGLESGVAGRLDGTRICHKVYQLINTDLPTIENSLPRDQMGIRFI